MTDFQSTVSKLIIVTMVYQTEPQGGAEIRISQSWQRFNETRHNWMALVLLII